MENTSNTLISIILPTFNGAARITRAIRSVQKQTYTNWELVVIDDGSMDETEKVLQEMALKDSRIRYLKNENNMGIQKTLNRGLREARGEYVARIDDDDIWNDETKLAQQVGYLDKDLNRVLIGTGVVLVDEAGKELIRYVLPESDQAIRNKLLGKNCFVHSSVLFRKDSALLVGGYDETKATRHVEDYDLWLKLGTKGVLGNLQLYAVTFTLRDEGLSSKNKLEQARKAFSIAKKYRHVYPGYFFAQIRSAIRIMVYGIILQFPITVFVNRLAKWYKENW